MIVLNCERCRPLRFGPDPDRGPGDPIESGNELARVIRETMERMKTPLWFWSVQQERGK